MDRDATADGPLIDAGYANIAHGETRCTRKPATSTRTASCQDVASTAAASGSSRCPCPRTGRTETPPPTARSSTPATPPSRTDRRAVGGHLPRHLNEDVESPPGHDRQSVPVIRRTAHVAANGNVSLQNCFPQSITCSMYGVKLSQRCESMPRSCSMAASTISRSVRSSSAAHTSALPL